MNCFWCKGWGLWIVVSVVLFRNLIVLVWMLFMCRCRKNLRLGSLCRLKNCFVRFWLWSRGMCLCLIFWVGFVLNKVRVCRFWWFLIGWLGYGMMWLCIIVIVVWCWSCWGVWWMLLLFLVVCWCFSWIMLMCIFRLWCWDVVILNWLLIWMCWIECWIVWCWCGVMMLLWVFWWGVIIWRKCWFVWSKWWFWCWRMLLFCCVCWWCGLGWVSW